MLNHARAHTYIIQGGFATDRRALCKFNGEVDTQLVPLLSCTYTCTCASTEGSASEVILRARSTPPYFYEIQDGTPANFVFEVFSKSCYLYSAKMSHTFVYFSVDVRCILGGPPVWDPFLMSRVAGGRPRRLRDDFVNIFDGFGPPFGDPRE